MTFFLGGILWLCGGGSTIFLVAFCVFISASSVGFSHECADIDDAAESGHGGVFGNTCRFAFKEGGVADRLILWRVV